MRKFIKNNWLFMIIFVAISFFVVLKCTETVNNFSKLNENREQIINFCQENMNSGTSDYDEYCTKILEEKNIKVDFYTVLTDILLYGIHILNGVAFLILIVPTLYGLNKVLKEKVLIHLLVRMSYKDFLIKFFKKAYRYVWILPFIAILVLGFSSINTTFDPAYSILYETSKWTTSLIYNPIIFCTLYILNICMYSFIFVNIALLVLRKNQRYILAILYSFITYVGIELFFEVVVNSLLFQLLLKSDIGYVFNIMNLFTFSDMNGIITLMIFTFIMFMLSFIAVYFTYRNKEKLIIDCEKNS